MTCPIIQHSDMTVCKECLQVWDTNDPCPPKCPKDKLERARITVACFLLGSSAIQFPNLWSLVLVTAEMRHFNLYWNRRRYRDAKKA